MCRQSRHPVRPANLRLHSASNGFDFYVALQSVRLYADPGTTIFVTPTCPGGGTGTLLVTVSGYVI
jgi:hypothetical protein